MACCTCSACSEVEQPCEWLNHCAVAAVAGINGRAGYFSSLLIAREGTCRGTGFPTGEAAARGSNLWSSSAGHSRVLVCRGSSGTAGAQFVDGCASESAIVHSVLHAVPLALPWLLAPALTPSIAVKWRR
jgi:hypothetical protein